MHRFKILFAATALIFSALFISAPSSVGAVDYNKCGGYQGIDFWKDANRGGAHIRFCGNSIYIPALGNYKVDPSCSFFCETWDSVISSMETFNMSSLQYITVFTYNNYNAGHPVARKIIIHGNTYTPYTGVFWNGTCCNDNIHSVRSTNG